MNKKSLNFSPEAQLHSYNYTVNHLIHPTPENSNKPKLSLTIRACNQLWFAKSYGGGRKKKMLVWKSVNQKVHLNMGWGQMYIWWIWHISSICLIKLWSQSCHFTGNCRMSWTNTTSSMKKATKFHMEIILKWELRKKKKVVSTCVLHLNLVHVTKQP